MFFVRPQADVLRSELDVLSDHYSQKCLELSHTEQSSKTRETELSHKERELELLKRENQVRYMYSYLRSNISWFTSERIYKNIKKQLNLVCVKHSVFQELKAKLVEEISRMRYFITGQRSGTASPGNTERTASEVEVMIK